MKFERYKIINRVLYIDEGVEIIPEAAFKDNASFNFAVLPKSIKVIGKEAFYNTQLRELRTSASIIETSAFQYSKLENVYLDTGVIKVDNFAFYQCKSLSSVHISDTVEVIGREAFNWDPIGIIAIPSSVKVVGNDAYSTGMLGFVNIMNGVKVIDNSIPSVARIMTINLPDSVLYASSSGYSTFSKKDDSNKLTSYILEEKSAKCDKKNTYELIKKSNGKYTLKINDGIKIIDRFNFPNNREIALRLIDEISMPDSVECILDYAFDNLMCINRIKFSNNLIYIGHNSIYLNESTDIELPESIRFIKPCAIRSIPDSVELHIYVPEYCAYPEEKIYSNMRSTKITNESIERNKSKIDASDEVHKAISDCEFLSLFSQDIYNINPDYVERMIINGADINVISDNGLTLLIQSVIQRNYGITRTLLSYGADYNIFDKNGYDVFSYLIMNDQIELIKILLNIGYDINTTNIRNETPLMIAILFNNLDIVKFLVENNAIINKENSFGFTPLLFAKTLNYKEILEYFRTIMNIVIVNPEDDLNEVQLILNGPR